MTRYLEVIETCDERINPFVTKEFSNAFQEASQGKRILVWQPSKRCLEGFETTLFCSDNLVWVRGSYTTNGFEGFEKVIIESPQDPPLMNYDGHIIIINPGYHVEEQIDSHTILRRFD